MTRFRGKHPAMIRHPHRSPRQQFVGIVTVIYIDPPFNTEQTSEHYDD